MSHLDPDKIALLALGEPVASDEERAHIARCPECSADVAEMAHAAAVARSTMAEDELETPSGDVWNRIHSELALSAGVRADPLESTPAHEPDITAPSAESGTTSVERHRPASAARRRRVPRIVWTLAASLVLFTAVGSVTWVAISTALTPKPVASATLDAFRDHPRAAGTAEVDEDNDGARTLTVTLDGAATSDDYREVWLIRNDGEALVSLGILEKSTGQFSIPSGLDLDEYGLVDISFEPVDGDPAHSGDSIVRGELRIL